MVIDYSQIKLSKSDAIRLTKALANLSNNYNQNSLCDRSSSSFFGIEFETYSMYANNARYEEGTFCFHEKYSKDGILCLGDAYFPNCQPSNVSDYVCISVRREDLDKTLIDLKLAPELKNTTQTQTIQGNTIISRQTLTLTLIDPTPGMLVQDALIGYMGNHLVDTSDVSELKVRLLGDEEMSGKIREALQAHNTKRGETVNLDILNRTGNSVKLLPLRMEEMQWELK